MPRALHHQNKDSAEKKRGRQRREAINTINRDRAEHVHDLCYYAVLHGFHSYVPRAMRGWMTRPPPPSTVHVRLKGRLGNQLFQYWVGKYVADRLNYGLTVFYTCPRYLCTRFFPHLGHYERYALPVAQTPNAAVFDVAKHVEHGTSAIDPDEVIRYEKKRQRQHEKWATTWNSSDDVGTTEPSAEMMGIVLNGYNETFAHIRKHADFVRALYARPAWVTGKRPRPAAAVHLRLGDLAHLYEETSCAYRTFVVETLSSAPLRKRLEEGDLMTEGVIIVSEDNGHPHAHLMKDAIRRRLPNARVRFDPSGERPWYGKEENSDTWVGSVYARTTEVEKAMQSFTVLNTCSVIVMANSTFSWWGAFLNPHRPKVYVGVSNKQPISEIRNAALFGRNGPPGWQTVSLDDGRRI